ncbi:hypothetical protein [Dethiosulfatarculus sandiegensis]|uniref:Lipoprotein n=1 Tax=Dethiosulfatarculus sandiegensis TaxID=1429043 RepID=A0A0D2J7H0_9BACT|nr:hypothetical protein [Dethiosulfatarculus sandiegensis]KIX11666.1 hypothetical protein X474_23145 [Dethiosulfatarculus sandiegensis]
MKPLCRPILLLVLTGLIAITGCAKIKELGKEFDPSKRPEDQTYQEAITPFISKGSVYHGPATQILIKSLSLTKAVREAMVKRQAQAFALSARAEEKLLQDQMAAADQAFELMVSAYVPSREWNDLNAKKPDWRIYLVNKKGDRLEPIDVRYIKERTPLNQVLYPFWSPWDKLFSLRFAKNLPDGTPFLADQEYKARLLVAGPPGSEEMTIILLP